VQIILQTIYTWKLQFKFMTKQVVQDKFKKDYIATYGLKGLESGGHISQAEYLE
jgi:hypothetical protein